MSAQLDDFCAWAQPCNGTYLNEQAFNALDVWQAAQAAMPVDPDVARYQFLRLALQLTTGAELDDIDADIDLGVAAMLGERARTGGAA